MIPHHIYDDIPLNEPDTTRKCDISTQYPHNCISLFPSMIIILYGSMNLIIKTEHQPSGGGP